MISIRFIKNLILRNLGLKLISLLIAVLLWLSMIPEEKTFSEKTLTVPLEIYNIPENTELVEKPRSTVDVTIQAPNRLLPQIVPAHVHASLDLKQASVDQEVYLLRSSMISIPEGAKVQDINPSQVTLKLEKSKEVMMSIEPNLIGELKEGLKLQKVEVIPSEVPIKGPKSNFKDEYKVRTTPIDLSPVTQSTEKKVGLILPSPSLRFASDRTEAKVKIIIQEKEKEKE